MNWKSHIKRENLYWRVDQFVSRMLNIPASEEIPGMNVLATSTYDTDVQNESITICFLPY